MKSKTVLLPDDLARRLEEAADQQQRSDSNLARIAIERWLENLSRERDRQSIQHSGEHVP